MPQGSPVIMTDIVYYALIPFALKLLEQLCA